MIKIKNIQTLENKQRELISNLSIEEIEAYIVKLTENYYSSFLNKDKNKYLHTVKELKELIKIFEFQYPNLNIYINFRLITAINKLLADNLNNDFKPVNISEVNIDEITINNGLSYLLKAFERSKKQWQQDRENERRVIELERENQQLKELLNNE